MMKAQQGERRVDTGWRDRKSEQYAMKSYILEQKFCH